MTKFGIWVDDPVSDVKKAKFWDELKRHQIGTAAIMLEGMGNGFDVKYTLSDLKTIGGLARSREVEIVLTIWPQPTVEYLDELESELGPYLGASGCVALECDLESNWISSKVKGFQNLDKAGDRLVAILKAFKEQYDIRLEGTTFTSHMENSVRADVANHLDCLLPQAYSVRNRTSNGEPIEVGWNDRLGPGRMQKLTLDLALTVPGVQMLSCGLAAYDQVWPGKTGEEAIQVAYEAALQYNPREIRLWSSKWVIGVRKNGYASRWLLSMKGK